MDWLTYLTLILQAVLAFPVILFLAYIIGWGFMSGALGTTLARGKKFAKDMAEAQKNDERDIL